MRIKNAFTLAETLIALMIIGVVATLTIPSLNNSSELQENYVGLTKAYSAVSNATQIITLEKGKPKFWNPNNVMSYYSNTLNVACSGSNCFSLSAYPEGNYMLDATNYFITGDGIFWGMKHTIACNLLSTNACVTFAIDVNGVKGPNQNYKDVFLFSVGTDGYVSPDENTYNTLKSGKIVNTTTEE